MKSGSMALSFEPTNTVIWLLTNLRDFFWWSRLTVLSLINASLPLLSIFPLYFPMLGCRRTFTTPCTWKKCNAPGAFIRDTTVWFRTIWSLDNNLETYSKSNILSQADAYLKGTLVQEHICYMLLDQCAFQIWSWTWSIFDLKYFSRL